MLKRFNLFTYDCDPMIFKTKKWRKDVKFQLLSFYLLTKRHKVLAEISIVCRNLSQFSIFHYLKKITILDTSLFNLTLASTPELNVVNARNVG